MDKVLKEIEDAIRTTIVISNPKGLKYCMDKIKKTLDSNGQIRHNSTSKNRLQL
jgi:hypothetical protein